MRRKLLRLLLALGAPVLLYLLSALLGAVLPGSTRDFPASEDRVEILLLAGPIHYDFLLPTTPEVRATFGFAADAGVPVASPDAEWVLVGWGARAFYTTTGSYADVAPGAVWRAIAGDDSVLRVDIVGRIPSDVILPSLTVSRAQFAALLENIRAELSDTRPIQDAGFTPTDAFFPAMGRFHLFRPCNQWIGEQLRRAGVRFGAWTPTPYSVRLSLSVLAD